MRDRALYSLRVVAVPGLALALAIALLAAAGCHPVRKRGSAANKGVTLAVLPAESDRFPKAAKAITDSLAAADVTGIDDKQVSKVSLEVVQLSIECTDESIACYAKVGKSLSADRLLFADIVAEKKRIKVKVTYFDVTTRTPRTAQRVFKSETEASTSIADLVNEATR